VRTIQNFSNTAAQLRAKAAAFVAEMREKFRSVKIVTRDRRELLRKRD